MKLISLLRGKVLALALVSVAVVGGATAVFAATSTGQNIVHAITGSQHSGKALDVNNHDNNSQANSGKDNNNGNEVLAKHQQHWQ